MTYTAGEGPDTARASATHLSAIFGPFIPLAVFFTERDRDAFVAVEALKAVRFSSLLLAAFIAATAVRLFVPLVGFLGTLAQWVIPIVAIYFCLAGFRLARQGEPANYPFQFKVEKSDD
ncbi:MAG: DUF4870 domain-containing protein [Demequinaceae bacterium]|nr:DUF4870 domain-containing protein [Demequinaceae bacterium]